MKINNFAELKIALDKLSRHIQHPEPGLVGWCEVCDEMIESLIEEITLFKKSENYYKGI